MKQNNTDRIEALLKNLPQTADQCLSSLTAGPHLKARIERAAMSPESTPVRKGFSLPRWMPAVVCCALVLAVMVGVGIGMNPGDNGIHQPTTLSIDSASLGQNTAPPDLDNHTADLNNTSMFIKGGSRSISYRTIWEPSRDGSFPLIGVNGVYYRMLNQPEAVDSSVLGNSLGTIAEFTVSPSLSGNNAILSNVAGIGEAVYGVRGMEDTLVAANVNGTLRVFQRVSFNGNALRGRETLDDTLQVKNHVIAMELSGVGVIDDARTCQQLLDTLFSCASYDSSGSINSKQALLMELDNGLVVQMAVSSDRLAACGVWNCPEFIEAFEDACN